MERKWIHSCLSLASVLSYFSAVNETDETDHRLSPDGCSGKGDTQTSEPYSNVVKQVPSLSVTDDTDSTTYATIDPDHEV